MSLSAVLGVGRTGFISDDSITAGQNGLRSPYLYQKVSTVSFSDLQKTVSFSNMSKETYLLAKETSRCQKTERALWSKQQNWESDRFKVNGYCPELVLSLKSCFGGWQIQEVLMFALCVCVCVCVCMNTIPPTSDQTEFISIL